MESSVRLEVPAAVWAGLARLRDLSRLVLVAIQRDDFDQMERLASEGQTLVDGLSLLLDGHADLPGDLRHALQDVARGHRQIVDGLRHRRDEVALELGRLRATRGRLRALKLRGEPADGSEVDRTT